jgi:hypothetical protein
MSESTTSFSCNAPVRTPRLSEQRILFYVVLGLIAAVVSTYAMIVRADFIAYDDNSHVFENPIVKEGLSWRGLGDAFTKFHASLWIPLTWISFMVDISLFGLNPGAMHAVNLAWHTAATVLLFLTLRRLTGGLWPSAFVAALFGLHPLNVESVAWIAERKNVLSTFFWIAAIAAYLRHTEKPRALSYFAALLLAGCALLSKPMAVTLPCTLLLLDFWPLHRWRTVPWPRLVVEKLPFFLLTAGSCWMTLHAPSAHAVVTTDTVSIAGRFSNALVSCAAYLGMIFAPVDLGVIYPHPVDPQPLRAGASAVLLATLTGLAWWQRKKRPYLLFGWLWFLGVLVPVLGFVQVGSQARADRFTYVPALGIFVAVVWLIRDLGARSPRALRLLAGPVLAACALLTARQVTYWMDGATLFEHTIAVTENNACAHSNAGLHRARDGDLEAAIRHFQQSLRIQPDQAPIWQDFGAALLRIGRPSEAAEAFRMSLRYGPENFNATYQLAVALQNSGAADEAIAQFGQILRDVPNSAGAHYHLALALESKGRHDEARAHLREAARLAPDDAQIAEAVKRLDV